MVALEFHDSEGNFANASHDATAPAKIIAIESLPEHFDVHRSVVNLENAYWGVMPRATAAVYAEKIAYVNRFHSLYARGAVPDHPVYAEMEAARERVAELLRVRADEIAFTRSGSEGLESLIVNYNGLKPGDAMVHCDLDYDNMIAAMEWLRAHRGVEVVRFDVPEPATTANILQAYEDVLQRTPRAKLLLLTHVSHRTGLVMPVKEIAAMARARGVDTILDSAHAVGCIDFALPDTGADFIGWSMHKWLAAPLSLGAIYIRRSRLRSIDVSYGNPDYAVDDTRARVPAGMANLPAQLTVPAAIDFHQAVGPAAKERHLRALRNAWVDRARGIPGVEIAVPDDPARSCVITGFRLRGMRSFADAEAVQRRLLERHKILTVARSGVAKGPVVRVTPSLYNTAGDMAALATALEAEHGMFG